MGLRRCFSFISLTMLPFALGCNSVVSSNPPTPVLAIMPIPPSMITLGQSSKFYATLSGQTDSTVSWSILPNDGSAGTIANDGTYIAPSSLKSNPTTPNVTVQASDSVHALSASASFALGYPTPVLASATPASVAPSTNVQIVVKGTGLSNVSAVTINGSPVSVTVVSDSAITLNYGVPFWAFGTITVIAFTPAPGGGTSQALNIPVVGPQVSYDAASRFLTQAGWGPDDASIAQVQQFGFSAWLDQQFATGTDYFWTDDDTGHEAADLILWAQFHEYSQLRTKMAWVWWKIYNSQLTTVGWVNTSLPDTCNRDAFGSFEKLLTDISFNPIMGETLDYDLLDYPTANPNQNFGREAMQLFSIGPVLLNQDGSPRHDANGQEMPAYSDDDIAAISHAVTGFVHPQQFDLGADPHGLVPLQTSATFPHDENPKTVLGTTVPGNQTVTQDVSAVTHILASHPNVAPFMSVYLIHELVTSNPSPEYVSRITSVWNNDGKGNRGNLQAVIKAVLLDPEARAGDVASGLTADEGRFRDPVQYFNFLFRATQDTNGQFSSLGMNADFATESIWATPTVFGYYSRTTTLPNSSLLAPESQLYNNRTIDVRVSVIDQIVYLEDAVSPIVSIVNWTYWGNLASGDGSAFIDYMNHLAYHGTMSEGLKQVLQADAQQNSDLTVRAKQMIMDTFLAPESAIQR